LVRGDYQDEVGVLQELASFGNPRKNLKIREARGRIRLSISNQGAVNHAIAIEEDGRPPVTIWRRERHTWRRND
jgi:hypothetical protein